MIPSIKKWLHWIDRLTIIVILDSHTRYSIFFNFTHSLACSQRDELNVHNDYCNCIWRIWLRGTYLWIIIYLFFSLARMTDECCIIHMHARDKENCTIMIMWKKSSAISSEGVIHTRLFKGSSSNLLCVNFSILLPLIHFYRNSISSKNRQMIVKFTDESIIFLIIVGY